VSCIQCPEGTWAPYAGGVDYTLCEPCPAGTVCSVSGLTTLALSTACPEGFVCSPRTNASSQFVTKCPAGYYCDFGTTPDTQFELPCEPGFGCLAGTPWSQRTSKRCSVGYYCPRGSTSPSPEHSKCPIGTTSSQTASSIEDCYREAGMDRICHVSPYNRTKDECLMHLKCCKEQAADAKCDFNEPGQFRTCVEDAQAAAGWDFDRMLTNALEFDKNFIRVEQFHTAHVTLDWRQLPKKMNFSDHYQVVIYFSNATCGYPNSRCPHGVRLQSPTQPLTRAQTPYFVDPGFAFNGTWFGMPQVDKHGLIELSVQSLHPEGTYFRIEVEILHGEYLENKNYSAVWETMKVNFTKPSRAWANQPEDYLFFAVVDGDDSEMNAALNMQMPLATVAEGSAEDEYVIDTRPLVNFVSRNSSIPLLPQQFTTRYEDQSWGVSRKREQIFTPKAPQTLSLTYLPFFSACRGFDNQIFIYQLFEDPEFCTHLPSIENTKPVLQWDPFSSPTAGQLENGAADMCQWTIECMYEEQISREVTPPRWFDKKPGDDLFYITADPWTKKEFLDDTGLFANMIGSNKMVAVSVAPSEEQYDDDTLTNGVPRQVILEFAYYQMTPERKRIISAGIRFEKYEVPENFTSPESMMYTLEVTYQALTYMALVNTFSFSPTLYIIFYWLIGAFCGSFVIAFWLFHRICTRLKDPPRFRFMSYIKVAAIPPFVGFFYACVPITLMFIYLEVTFHQINLFGDINSEYISFSESAWVDTAAAAKAKSGRFAVAFLTFGIYAVLTGATGMNPRKNVTVVKEQDADELTIMKMHQESDEDLRKWKRSHIFFASILVAVTNTLVIEFSYSDFFGDNIYTCLGMLNVWNVVFEEALESFLGESLFLAPLIVTSMLIELTATMGADDFLDFVTSYFIELLVLVAMRVYIDPGVEVVLQRIELAQKLWAKYLERRKRQKEDDYFEDEDADEDDWMMDLDDAGRSPVEEIVRFISGYSAEALSLIFTPFLIGIVWWADPHLLMSKSYGIKTSDFQFYMLFGVVMLVPTFVMDIFLHNIQELFHGWKVYEYFKYAAHRFDNRSCRWKGQEPLEDQSIEHEMRSIDLLCFSSQYYFLTSYFTTGLVMIIFGMQILLRKEYNIFSDKMTPFVVALALVAIWCIKWVCWRLGKRFVWRFKPVAAEVDESGLALSAFEAKGDLELPMWGGDKGGDGGKGFGGPDISSETFRHRFFIANKPWIMQQLKMSMSPRSNLVGDNDGYGDDPWVYDDGAKLRTDVSDDEGTSDDWAAQKVKPINLDSISKLIAQRWLARVRRRLGLPENPRAALNISSEDESDDDFVPQDAARKRQVSHKTRAIAYLWLAQLRGVMPKQHQVNAQFSSDDSDSDRPIRPSGSSKMNARTREIANAWLAKLPKRARRIANTDVAPPRPSAISDDSDDSDSEDAGQGRPASEKTKQIARLWLKMRRRQPEGGRLPPLARGGNPLDSDSDSDRPKAKAKGKGKKVELSSDSDSDSDDVKKKGDAKKPITAKTKAIAKQWLQMSGLRRGGGR